MEAGCLGSFCYGLHFYVFDVDLVAITGQPK